MALDDLLARLRQEAEAQASTLVAEGRLAAERLVRDADTAVATDRGKRLTAHETALRTDAAVVIERARKEATLILLQARRGAIDRILAGVGESLPEAATDPHYPALAEREFDRALEVLAGRRAELSASPQIAERLAARAPAHIEVRTESGFTGFRVRTSDGRIEIDATLEARLRRLTPALSIELAWVMAVAA